MDAMEKNGIDVTQGKSIDENIEENIDENPEELLLEPDDEIRGKAEVVLDSLLDVIEYLEK